MPSHNRKYRVSNNTDRVWVLTDLVDHRESVDAGESVERVDRFFQQHNQDFAAVTESSRVLGICSRSQIRGLLGGRYGFSLYHRQPIGNNLMPHCVKVQVDHGIRDVLERTLSRSGSEFYDDVVLVGAEEEFLGMISTRQLVSAQSALMQEQFEIVATQQEELSQSLKQQRELERHVVEKEKATLLHTLAGGIAHELNNKLMPMIGYAELLQSEMSDLKNSRLAAYCQTMRDSGFEAARIIRQLLQLSRPSRTERVLCDLRMLVGQSLTLVALRIKETNTTLHLTLPKEPVRILADGAEIKQVLLNLVLNAIDAMEDMPEKILKIVVHTESSRTCLTVSDCGGGIPNENLTQIFDPFFTTKAPNRGTGLGLSVSLSIVKQHGGEISVDSRQGTGTTFQITLPMEHAGISEIPGTQEFSARVSGNSGSSVLVVEDDDFVAGFIGDALKTRCGCNVSRAANGYQATEILRTSDFDMIISDVRMPKMNGLEFLEWIRSHRPTLQPRLLFITGDASGTELNAAIQQSGVPTLKKPLSVEALVNEFWRLCPPPTASVIKFDSDRHNAS